MVAIERVDEVIVKFDLDFEVQPDDTVYITGTPEGIASCHGADFAGGPIVGGDPSWVPARNLTPHATGMGGWSYEQFVAAMREGRRPDGTALLEPMTLLLPYAQRMTDVEMEALWRYLQSLPAVASEG